jgi:hypothetical protein
VATYAARCAPAAPATSPGRAVTGRSCRRGLQAIGHPARELDFIIPGDLAGLAHGERDPRTGACHFSENQAGGWGQRFFTPAVEKAALQPELFAILGATPYSLRRGGISLRLRAEDPQTVASECGTSLRTLSKHYAYAIEDLCRNGPRSADTEARRTQPTSQTPSTGQHAWRQRRSAPSPQNPQLARRPQTTDTEGVAGSVDTAAFERGTGEADPNAGTPTSRLAEVDLRGDDLEVLDVVGHQRHAKDVGGGRDREVHRSTPGRSSALGDERVQPPALARRGSVERQRVEMLLDGPKPAHSQRTSLIVACNKHSEVQLRQRDDTDRRILLRPPLGHDQHRGIEQDRHDQPLAQGSASCPPSAWRSCSSVGSGGVAHRSASWILDTH